MHFVDREWVGEQEVPWGVMGVWAQSRLSLTLQLAGGWDQEGLSL